MGVPVVALSGSNFVSRMGVSFLRTLGQPNWIAEDSDAYVSAAVELARQVGSLRRGRAALRSQMSACALCDIEAYVQHFQALLERMWTQHCIGGGRVLLAAMPAQA
jgi:predicted O-linked N-acetylglucosamine transferase (SPINDLY family)